MKIVVTGAHGKVGRITTRTLLEAGHEVVATDLTRPGFDRKEAGEAQYLQADLTDAGEAFAVVRGADAVVHGWTPKRSWRDYLDENGHALTRP